MTDSIQFQFDVETRWTIFAKYTSHVTVYSDRVHVKRIGRVGDIPEEVTIYFRNVSSISYTKNNDYLLSYIAFAGMSNSSAQSIGGLNVGKGMVATSSANPWSDAYGIVFKLDLYEKGKKYYQRLVEVFENYKHSHTEPITQSVIYTESAIDKLKKLKELLDLNIISEQEYEEKKKKIMAEI